MPKEEGVCKKEIFVKLKLFLKREMNNNFIAK